MQLTAAQKNLVHWIKKGINKEGSMEALARTCSISSGTIRRWLADPPYPIIGKRFHGKLAASLRRLAEHLKMDDWESLFKGPHKEDHSETLPVPVQPQPLPAQACVMELMPVYQKREEVHKSLNTALLVLEGVQELAKKRTMEGVQERFSEIMELYTLASGDMEVLKIILDHLSGKVS